MISMIFSRSMVIDRTKLSRAFGIVYTLYSTFMLFNQYFWKKCCVRLAYPKVAVARERNVCA